MKQGNHFAMSVLQSGAAGLLLAGISMGAFAGCAHDRRIPLHQFLDQQRALAPQQVVNPDARSAAAAEVEVPENAMGPYRVGPGDTLGIAFAGPQVGLMPVFQVRVDRNGMIELPVVGPVNVLDKELEDVDTVIREAYVPRVYSEVTVNAQLIAPEATNVLVVGAVTTPGLVKLRHNERNMLFAIVGAGGISVNASGKAKLRRLREPDVPSTFDLTDPVQLREALAIAPLNNGDIITVEAAQPNEIFVGGLVYRSSPQSYPAGTRVSVLQAIAAASGLRTDVYPKEGTLVRRMPDGNDVHVKLDLNRIARGDDPNIDLAPGDILWVPETWQTRVQEWVNRNIFLRAGVSVNYSVTGVEYFNRNNQQSGGGNNGNSLQNSYDPFGFLNQNRILDSLNNRPSP